MSFLEYLQRVSSLKLPPDRPKGTSHCLQVAVRERKRKRERERGKVLSPGSFQNNGAVGPRTRTTRQAPARAHTPSNLPTFQPRVLRETFDPIFSQLCTGVRGIFMESEHLFCTIETMVLRRRCDIKVNLPADKIQFSAREL